MRSRSSESTSSQAKPSASPMRRPVASRNEWAEPVSLRAVQEALRFLRCPRRHGRRRHADRPGEPHRVAADQSVAQGGPQDTAEHGSGPLHGARDEPARLELPEPASDVGRRQVVERGSAEQWGDGESDDLLVAPLCLRPQAAAVGLEPGGEESSTRAAGPSQRTLTIREGWRGDQPHQLSCPTRRSTTKRERTCMVIVVEECIGIRPKPQACPVKA